MFHTHFYIFSYFLCFQVYKAKVQLIITKHSQIKSYHLVAESSKFWQIKDDKYKHSKVLISKSISTNLKIIGPVKSAHVKETL